MRRALMCPQDVFVGIADAMHHKTVPVPVPPPPVYEGRGLAVPGVLLMKPV